MASPRLWGDLLLTGFICHGQTATLIAWDTATGERRWEVDVRGGEALPGYASRSGGSLVVMTVGDAKPGGGTPVALCSSGRVVRLPDGKVYDALLPQSCATYAVDDATDAVFGCGSHDRGSIRWGVELRMAGDELAVEARWAEGKSWGAASPVFADGRLVGPRAQIDPATGHFLGHDASVTDLRRAKPSAPQTRHLLLVANGHVYGLRQEGGPSRRGETPAFGVSEVWTLDGEKVAENRLSAGPWDKELAGRLQQQGFGRGFSYACAMNIAGDALYIASQDYLYAIGR
jgi:hypothetical protein